MRENRDFVVPVNILTTFARPPFSWAARHTTVCLDQYISYRWSNWNHILFSKCCSRVIIRCGLCWNCRWFNRGNTLVARLLLLFPTFVFFLQDNGSTFLDSSDSGVNLIRLVGFVIVTLLLLIALVGLDWEAKVGVLCYIMWSMVYLIGSNCAAIYSVAGHSRCRTWCYSVQLQWQWPGLFWPQQRSCC